MTLNRLLKTLLNVKGATVDGAEFTESDSGEAALTVHVHVQKKDRWRCPVCGENAMCTTTCQKRAPGVAWTSAPPWCGSARVCRGSAAESTASSQPAGANISESLPSRLYPYSVISPHLRIYRL